jgi:long-subunit fatty acid transport protein
MKKAIVILIIAGLAAGAPAAAQTKVGTSFGQFLGIEPGARFAGMGNAGVAVDEGLQAVYYNPGTLGALTRPVAQFTHNAWFAGINYNYAAMAYPMGFGTLFGSVTALSSGEIEVRTVTQPLGTGERYTASDVAIAFGYGRHITNRFVAGAQVNYVNERIWKASADAFTVSLGATYRLTPAGIKLGASLSNLGTNARYTGQVLAIQYDPDPDQYGNNSALPADQYTGDFPVPILFRIGVSMPYRVNEESALLLAVDAYHPSDNTESVSLGAEWLWKDALALRAGYQNLFQEDSELGLTLGAGVMTAFSGTQFQFDYGWGTHEVLDSTHRVTFGLEF